MHVDAPLPINVAVLAGESLCSFVLRYSCVTRRAIPIFIMRLSNVIILIENCNVFMKEEFLGIFG